MYRPGPKNLITDVAGLRVGHATDELARSGVTAVICPGAWAAAADARGGAPGTRETEALAAENLVGRAHAVVLGGGSVFGLAAADGVAAAMSMQGVGLQLAPGTPCVPIVPAAVLYDLANGGDKHWAATPPYRDLGVRALGSASADFSLGAVGAGRGAMAGLVPGGIGSASLDLGEGLMVGALAAVNSVGSALMPDGETFWAWPFELAGEFGGGGPPPRAMDLSDPSPHGSRLAALGRMQPGVNTTLVVAACSADLSSAQCKRVAMMAQDGIARAIRPAHTPFDGDIVFALAGGTWRFASAANAAAQLGLIGSAAADCVTRAIARAVHCAGTNSSRTALAIKSGGSNP